MQYKVDELKRMLSDAERVVIFTGAGISTESGIPDFRSPGGVWSKTTPIYFDEFMRSEQARREAWRRKFETDRDMLSAEPNRGHRAVAKLIESGKAIAVITQNIDGLHERSGIPPEQIIELHGNATYATCLSCHKRFELEPIKAAFLLDESLPHCDDCNGIVKTATISFGQSMPVEAMHRAEFVTNECDLFISIGSSLVVYPAAGFPIMAKERGAGYVIVNRDPTEQDSIADLVINAEIGEAFGDAVGVN
ncbi:MAG: Sir2 family NAD-dependent protein deacetylase [Gammaproteobacteria bacterium]|nr:Sir2 family NAD-dependent protein deacetylase [Gammaproteobacteria bacterium]